jgi:Ca2+-binding RTX toxin-like protein
MRLLVLGAVAAAVLVAEPAAASYTAQVEGDTLRVAGDAASDTLALRLASGAPGTLELDVDADGTGEFAFDRSTFSRIEVRAGDGDDNVHVNQLFGAFTDEALTIDGGAGADTLIGGAGTETLIGGSGDDMVDGNLGIDFALLGSGNDTFNWDPGDSSDRVDGQGGSDVLQFNGSGVGESIAALRTGPRVQLTRNVGNVVMDLGGVDRIALRPLGGGDAVAVADLTGTGTRSVDVDLRGFDGAGDAQPDAVVAHGTTGPDQAIVGADSDHVLIDGLGTETRVLTAEVQDDVNVALLEGDDAATMSHGVPGPGVVNVDGGPGADTVTYRGTAGPDQLNVVANGAEVATVSGATARLDSISEDLVVQGLGEDDLLTAVGNIAALTKLTQDGGPGDDTLLGGNGADTQIGGSGNDAVDGNQGLDVALLGGGNDTFSWDPGDGNDTVEGQGGSDALHFIGSAIGELLDVSANGERTRFTRNIANIVMDLADVERIHSRPLGGADTLTVGDLAGTDVKTVEAELVGPGNAGDAQADTVIAGGTAGPDAVTVRGDENAIVVDGLAVETRVTGGEDIDNVNVATFGDADTVTMGLGVPGPAVVNADGGEGADRVVFRGSGEADQLPVVANGTEASVAVTGNARLDLLAEELIVQGLSGDDLISAVGNLAALTKITMDGGSGADDVRGGNGADVLLGGSGNDAVDGNQGLDVALLGGGNDTFSWDPGDGNDTVEGQGGSDALQFNGSAIGELFEVSASGERVRFTRNIANIAMDLDDVERLALRALGGADQMTVNDMTGTDLDVADIDLSGPLGGGDSAQDTVIVNGTGAADAVKVQRVDDQVQTKGLAALTRIAGSELLNDTLRIQTLTGDDSVTVDPNAELLINHVIDLGADN